jgi:nicotinamidase-related amidase
MKVNREIDRGRCALLLVDLQEEQRVNPHYPVAGFEKVIANARELLAGAREAKVRIFHAAYRRDFDLLPQRPFEPLAADGRPAFSDKASPLTAICREVQPAEGEQVIYKNDASAFSEPALGAALRQAKIEWLILAGVWSEACVAASVRDAIASGLRVLLVKDACGSGTETMHQTAILHIANRLYGGAVADTARALALMRGEQAEIWMPDRPVPILFNYVDASRHYDRL